MNFTKLRYFSCARWQRPHQMQDFVLINRHNSEMSFKRYSTGRWPSQQCSVNSFCGYDHNIKCVHSVKTGNWKNYCRTELLPLANQMSKLQRRLFTSIACHNMSVTKSGRGINLDQSRRHVSLKPAALVDAAPPSIQPYLKLIRLDKPIGKYNLEIF